MCNRDLTPAVNEGPPQCYVNLMKICWDEDPEKCSSAKDHHSYCGMWNPSANKRILRICTACTSAIWLGKSFQMSADDIYDHILPHHKSLKKIFGIKMYDTESTNIIDSSSTSCDFDSRIATWNGRTNFNVINKEHATKIASWIDNNANMYFMSNNPYEFKLLFRGSRD
ncbi:hypothetical protein C2G38_2169457 [Gigaspora rosea]|uniref:Serine-threonine/tyrosine-protein kinase catalytic domain-containing protein n=1 Tax=Gigaspora rosea TaxID=44941 RepID=A0A397VNM7_9GLOM|nr:hypothetical protein C2G38_2169457 [Gigaspora rosea]